MRLRDLGITIGTLPTGRYNAITDVEGVQVGHTTLIYDTPRIARTGVTVILPRQQPLWDNHCFAAFHNFNGNGEFTGIHWLEETGLLTTPIAITNTHQVGIVRDTLVAYEFEQRGVNDFALPLVAETYDGWLSDSDAFFITGDHVREAIANARGGAVAEGNVGGGTGMICHEFKGGIGTSSRLVTVGAETYTVGVLVQANYGRRGLLRVDGVPVGREIGIDKVPSAKAPPTPDGSIIIIVATDAPLLSNQCKRLTQRAVVGLARVGGVGYNSSGDLILAFATGNDIPPAPDAPFPLRMLPHEGMNYLFDATAEATEEAILNALCAAETMRGYKGHIAPALPHDQLQAVMQKYNRLKD
jgi:D-aminopeptidase